MILTGTMYNLRLDITFMRKILIARSIVKKRRGFAVTKLCRDFSQKPFITSFSSANLLPPNTFFGSNICELDT